MSKFNSKLILGLNIGLLGLLSYIEFVLLYVNYTSGYVSWNKGFYSLAVALILFFYLLIPALTCSLVETGIIQLILSHVFKPSSKGDAALKSIPIPILLVIIINVTILIASAPLVNNLRPDSTGLYLLIFGLPSIMAILAASLLGGELYQITATLEAKNSNNQSSRSRKILLHLCYIIPVLYVFTGFLPGYITFPSIILGGGLSAFILIKNYRILTIGLASFAFLTLLLFLAGLLSGVQPFSGEPLYLKFDS